ncbi:hypothetical protein PSU4_50250 [Pseudonocardia sulfidoxydans NBRC 16205]|uniref:Uncharacterized protein n=1 Tax=Pseudonocardia sulfidoxydans NBRC 16205 TaxID=1223511 RepID=A0A511DMN6_9PSEU|nr:hypothetical protein PSU4_50250 [Pseudonocardia sulfidoxydans NBRC 16205]
MIRSQTPSSPLLVRNDRAPTGSVQSIVDAALCRLKEECQRVETSGVVDGTDRAARADRLAELHTRRARWWRVLWRHEATRRRSVYLDAVAGAEWHEWEQAAYWRRSASGWNAAAEGSTEAGA